MKRLGWVKKKISTLFLLSALTLSSCLTLDSAPVTAKEAQDNALAASDDTIGALSDAAAIDAYGMIGNLLDGVTSATMKSLDDIFFEGAMSWTLASVKSQLGAKSDFEQLVYDNLSAMNAKIDSLTPLVRDFVTKIEQEQSQVIPRMESFSSLFLSFSGEVEGLYQKLMDINDKNKTGSFLENLGDLVRTICRVDGSYDLTLLPGPIEFAQETIRFAKAFLPNATYDDDIFSDARTYFDYNSVWSHESYPNREAFRTGSLALLTKAKELSELTLLYCLSEHKINGLYADENGNVLIYMIGDQLYMNFDDSASMSEYDNRYFKSGISRTIRLIKEDGSVTEIPFTTLTGLLQYISSSLNDVKYPIMRSAAKNLDLLSNAISLMDSYAELKKYCDEIAEYARRDLKEMVDNSDYRIHLRLDSGVVTCFNRYNAPFYPSEVQKSTTKVGEKPRNYSFTLPCNCKPVTYIAGYGKAWVNEVFTPSDYNTVSKFISYMPESYRASGSASTFYDYLHEHGFVFYGDKTRTSQVSKGYMAVGTITYAFDETRTYGDWGYYLYLFYIAIDLSAKISEYQPMKRRGAKNGHVIYQGGEIVQRRTIIESVTGFNNPLYNIGFPSYMRNVRKYANTNKERAVEYMQHDSPDASWLFGYSGKKDCYVSVNDVTGFGENGVDMQ